MMTWREFREAEPALANAGRSLFYQWKLGIGFLATVRRDGGPRVHPICPVINDEGCFGLIIPGPKLEDLRRDPRYALHSETSPPPNIDDAFYLTGFATERSDRGIWNAIADQFLAERELKAPWAGFEEQALIEFEIEQCLLTLTDARDAFPKGHTIWKAPPAGVGAR